MQARRVENCVQVAPAGYTANQECTGGVGVSVIEVAIGCSHAPGKFRVEIARSPAGEAAVEIALDAGALQAERARFQQTLLVSAVLTRQRVPGDEPSVRLNSRRTRR